MKSPNTKSSSELQKDVHKEIRNLRRSLDELQGRLSPGQIIDAAIFYPHGKNLRATFEHLKRNPVGTTFLSLGTILLMEDEAHKTYEQRARSELALKKESLSSKATSAKNTVQSNYEDLKRVASGIKSDVKEKAFDLRDNVQQKGQNLKESVKSNFSDIQEETSDKAAGIKPSENGLKEDSVSEKFGRGKDKLTEIYKNSRETLQNLDPTMMIALGAGLGALTGASLPVSDKEGDFIEEKLGEKFSHLSQDLKDAINESSEILKDLVINDVKEMSFKVFK